MFWLTVLLVFLLKIKTEKNDIIINKVHFLKNDFWDILKTKLKTDKGYLYGIRIVFKDDNCFKYDIDFCMDDCFYLDYSNLGYAKFHERLEENLNSLLNSHLIDQKFIRFHFLFTDDLIEDYEQFKNYQRRKQYFESFKWVEKSLENDYTINLKCDETKARMIFIKENIRRFVDMKFLKLHEYTKKSGELKLIEDLENCKNFDLYHFKSYSVCLESLKKFVDSFQYFRLEEGKVAKKKIDKNVIIKVNDFEQFIDKKIEEDIKKLSIINNKNKQETFCSSFVNMFHKKDDAFKTLKLLIKRCFNDIKGKILKKDIFFQIGGRYNVDYYINEIYNNAFKLAKANYEVFQSAENNEKDKILNYFDRSFYKSMKELQKKVIEDLFKTDFFHEHFLNLNSKKIETPNDYAVVEKILCDYHNMLGYMTHCGFSFKKSSVSSFYYPPVFIDNFDHKIISGIEIRLLGEYVNDTIFIDAFNSRGRKVYFEKGLHYSLQFNKLYCTSDILREMNIEELNVYSEKCGIINKIKVNEFLSI